jgi:NitT/TauT family transport system permease protein
VDRRRPVADRRRGRRRSRRRGAGSGLAFRIAESGYRLNIPRMCAALLLLSAAGIVIYGLLALVSHLVLRRWHESALGKEN